MFDTNVGLCFVFGLLIVGLKVHIAQGNHEGRPVIVSWETMEDPGSNEVIYWKDKSQE